MRCRYKQVRSSGTFAVDFLNLDYQKFVQENSYLHPNPDVLSILRRKAGLTPSFIEEVQVRDAATLEADSKKIQKKIDDGEIFS